MIKKIYKLKTEDYKLPFKSIYNGEFLNVRIHLYNTFSNTTSPYSRFGVNINKRVSKSAVGRNRIKRLVYDILSTSNIIHIKESLKNTTNNKTKLYIIILKKVIDKNNIEKLKEELKCIN